MEFAPDILVLPVLLAGARFAGMMIFSPVLSEAAVPARLRAMLALAMALAVSGRVAMPAAIGSDAQLTLALGSELLIGLAIGYAARLVFVGVELGAFHISQQMGLSLGEVFNPLSEESSDSMRQFFGLLALVVFLAIGGHRVLIRALVGSFDTLPLMTLLTPGAILATATALLTTSFLLALKVAAPVLAAMLLAGLALGAIQRTMPQLNILSIGFPLRVVLGAVLVAAILAAGAMPDLLSWATAALGQKLGVMVEMAH